VTPLSARQVGPSPPTPLPILGEGRQTEGEQAASYAVSARAVGALVAARAGRAGERLSRFGHRRRRLDARLAIVQFLVAAGDAGVGVGAEPADLDALGRLMAARQPRGVAEHRPDGL